MKLAIGGVYLVNFPRKGGNEFYGRHYAVVLSNVSKDDGTLLVAPITGKKSGRKYRGGITIDNHKYQRTPSYDNSFIYVRKIQEVDKRKAIGTRNPQLDEDGNVKKDKNGKELFYKEYKKAYQLDETDFSLLSSKCKEVLKLKW